MFLVRKAVKIGALKFTAFLSPFLITVIILILTFFIGSSIISNVAELFEAKNTPEKIYDMLEIAADEDQHRLAVGAHYIVVVGSGFV